MKYVFYGTGVVLALLSIVAWQWRPSQVDARLARMSGLIEQFDADGDGRLGRGELLEQLPSLQQGDREEALASFQLADRNGDGIVSEQDKPVKPLKRVVWATDDNPMRREQIALFNRLNPDYHLTLDPLVGRAALEKVVVQSLAGVGPDLFDCYSPFQLQLYVRAGVARDCTEDLRARGIDLDAVWPCLKPLSVLNGRAYGHPDNAHAAAVWFNKDLFDAAGEPYPEADWSWDDLIATAARLTRRDERGTYRQAGLMMGPWDWRDLLLPQWGAAHYTPEGTRCLLDSPDAEAAVRFYYDLMYAHHVMPSPAQMEAMAAAGGWGTGVLTLFGASRGAMAVGGRWWLCLLRGEDYAHLRLGAVPLPKGPKGGISGGGRSTLVNRSGNIEGALLFLEYMHGPAWNNLVNEQADALAPVMKYNYSEEFLFNPDYPQEDYNAVWRAALENAEPVSVSPFVNGQIVDRILGKQIDLVTADVKQPELAMRDAAREINEEIVAQLRLDPALEAKYEEALRQGALPAWDHEEDRP